MLGNVELKCMDTHLKGNLKFLLKEFQFVMSLKIWPHLTYTVCNAPVSVMSKICNHNSYDVILMTK